jgi:hypothetical protein
MTALTFRQALPDVYSDLLPRFFDRPMPREQYTTCESCAMLPEGREEAPGTVHFSPATKCCTYYPSMPNYLVGGVLESRGRDLAGGRRRMRAVIAARRAVAPLGVHRPAKLTSYIGSTPELFGRSTTIVCPYYDRDTGGCTVRPYRIGVCYTWYCKHNHGKESMTFWQMLRNYLTEVEHALSRYALHEIGFPAGKILASLAPDTKLTTEEIDDRPLPEHEYRKLWDRWAGREETLYRAAHHAVQGLSRKRFEAIGGITQKIVLEELERLYRDVTSPSVPDPLRRSPELRVHARSSDRCVLVGYSRFDPLEVSRRIHDMLGFFDGRTPTDEVVRRIHAETGVAPDAEVIESLYHMRALTEAE